MLWTDLRVLIVDTGRVWWRLLPMIVGGGGFGRGGASVAATQRSERLRCDRPCTATV